MRASQAFHGRNGETFKTATSVPVVDLRIDAVDNA